MQVQNRLAQIRNQRGLSAIALAEKIGVKRQTIYAIEAQKYTPNTLLALRLAQVLDVAVEELFSVSTGSEASDKPTPVHLLANEASVGQPDRLVRLCQVGSRMIGVPSAPVSGELPAADAVVVGSDARGRTLVRAFQVMENEGNRLIVAGCDPAMPVLARHMFRHGNIELIPVGCSSLQALKWLKDQRIHVAGTHLCDESSSRSNRRAIERFFPKGGFRIVTFASWEEGLVVARTNPKGISGLSDLTRNDVTLINREVGAGARRLLDRSLKKEGISPMNIRGYELIAGGHVLAAWHVHTSKADCCIATRAAARVFSLDFIPLVSERYDLVIPDRHWELPAVQVMLDSLNRASLKKELEVLGGYDTSETGNMVN
ncbi:MAG TPA: substrate-binding domain-containing protein [Acidobacteriota bacterium]|nr:substrate-binding domain-containing protein [Acidobacteriota bacterium]